MLEERLHISFESENYFSNVHTQAYVYIFVYVNGKCYVVCAVATLEVREHMVIYKHQS